MHREPRVGRPRAHPDESFLVPAELEQYRKIAGKRPFQRVSRQAQNTGLLGLFHCIDEDTGLAKSRVYGTDPDAHQPLDSGSGDHLAWHVGVEALRQQVRIYKSCTIFTDERKRYAAFRRRTI